MKCIKMNFAFFHAHFRTVLKLSEWQFWNSISKSEWIASKMNLFKYLWINISQIEMKIPLTATFPINKKAEIWWLNAIYLIKGPEQFLNAMISISTIYGTLSSGNYYQKNKIYYRNHRIFQHERGIRLLYEAIRKDYQVLLDDPREHTATWDAIAFQLFFGKINDSSLRQP